MGNFYLENIIYEGTCRIDNVEQEEPYGIVPINKKQTKNSMTARRNNIFKFSARFRSPGHLFSNPLLQPNENILL